MDQREIRRYARRAGRGDQDAAGRLFDHCYPRLYRYALAKLGSTADAEDVAAETFARALRDLDRFKWKGGGFEAWLFRVASNLVVDHVRLAARERGDGADEEDDQDSEAWSPEEAFLRSETAGEVQALVARLAPAHSEVLLLRFVAGLESSEVGRVMGRTTNAVRQLQFRALDQLRRMVDESVMLP